jgi:hypothetical protein
MELPGPTSMSMSVRKIGLHVVAPGKRPMERILGPQMGDFVRSHQVSTIKSDAQGGEDAGDSKHERRPAYRHHGRDLRPVGVEVIFDDDL